MVTRYSIVIVGGAVLLSLIALLLFSPQEARAANVTIDDFDDWQGDNNAKACPNPGPYSEAAEQTATGAIGGGRDFYAETTADPNAPNSNCMTILVDADAGNFDPWAQREVNGSGEVQWDGPDPDGGNSLDPTGLGGVDLTDGGTNDTLYFFVVANNQGIDALTTTVYTDGSNASEYTVNLPIITGSSASPSRGFAMPMSDFDVLSGTGADFTNVGAITWTWNVIDGRSGPTISVFDARSQDTSPPTVSAEVSGEEGDNGWYVDNPTVTITANDAESGIESIEYRLNAGAVQTYTGPFEISNEGTTDVEFRATNEYGFVSDWQTLQVLVDTEAPTVDVSVDPPEPNANGWYNEPVELAALCTDTVSGFDTGSTIETSIVFSGEGESNITANCRDLAGNSASAPYPTLRIDMTDPIIDAGGPYQVAEGETVPLDANGSSDGVSGIDTILWDLDGDGTFETSNPAPFTAGNGPDSINVAVRVTDLAGNTVEEQVTITVTNEPPEITSVNVQGTTVTVIATDFDQDLDYEFDCDDDGVYEFGPQTGNSAECPAGTVAGEYQINVRVSDADGGISTSSATLYVEAPLCANRYNGDVRMPRDETCAATEVMISLPANAPLDLCVNRYNGDLRYSRSGACATTELAVNLPDDAPLAVCANRYNGDLRVPRDGQTCAATEWLREIGYSLVSQR